MIIISRFIFSYMLFLSCYGCSNQAHNNIINKHDLIDEFIHSYLLEQVDVRLHFRDTILHEKGKILIEGISKDAFINGAENNILYLPPIIKNQTRLNERLWEGADRINDSVLIIRHSKTELDTLKDTEEGKRTWVFYHRNTEYHHFITMSYFETCSTKVINYNSGLVDYSFYCGGIAISHNGALFLHYDPRYPFFEPVRLSLYDLSTGKLEEVFKLTSNVSDGWHPSVAFFTSNTEIYYVHVIRSPEKREKFFAKMTFEFYE